MRSSNSFGHRFARLVIASSVFGVTTALATAASAATTYYVSPTGTGGMCSHASPCSLDTGAFNAVAGDFVVLLDGTYAGQQLIPVNSGTASAWITYQADVGAVPILDGKTAAATAVAVNSNSAVYVRFVGIVARNWAGGFSNEWIGSPTDGGPFETNANGNWQYVNCIADGNTRNGFAFNSSQGVLVSGCIAAHNGTSTTSSWSSGFQLFGVQGTAQDNIVEGNVSFENMDAQKHTDGSGFITDTMVTGLSFVNNLAFFNGGSGIRLTDSANISIVNNTLYHNGQDTTDTGPTNPGEIYFTSGSKTEGLTMVNNVAVPTGSTQDPAAGWIFNGGTLTIPSSNLVSNSSTLFAGPTGSNPDFRPATGSSLVDKGSATNAPAVDIGFDPKCLTAGAPTDIAVPSWTKYSIDYTYIKSVGGVAGCFAPGNRPAGAGFDIGAYELNATPEHAVDAGALPPSPAPGTNVEVVGGPDAGDTSDGGGGASAGDAGQAGDATLGGDGPHGGSGASTGNSGASAGVSGSGTGSGAITGNSAASGAVSGSSSGNGGTNASGSSGSTPTGNNGSGGGASGSGNGTSPSGCAVTFAGSSPNGFALLLWVPALFVLRGRRRVARIGHAAQSQ
jgi:parallel beta-helix repeat protein